MIIISQFTNAQLITQAEYYIDGDPGFGNGTAINVSEPVNLLELDIEIPIDLVPGIHTLFIRTKDENGNWSLTGGRAFYSHIQHSELLTQAEYYIDADPGFGNGNKLSIENGTEINIEAELSTQNIPLGTHSVGVRTKDDQGRWSLTEFRTFHIYRSAQIPIIEAEYFIGEDPGFGNGIALPIETNGNAADINAAIDVTGLELGDYIIYVRVLNQNNSWSLHEVIPFTICEFAGAISSFDFIQFNNTVSFINKSQFATSYFWDFDDGQTSVTEQPAHFFNQPGTYYVMLIASNDCGIDTSYQEITISSIDAIKADKGGQGGLVTAIITGNGFADPSIVRLCKSDSPDIELIPDTVLITSSHTIIVVLNLAAAPLGYYDVKVINGIDTLILNEGFEVIARIEPTFDIYISGPSLFRTNSVTSFNVTIVNHGNVDGLLVPVTIGNIPWSDENGELNFITTSGDYIDPRDIVLLSGSVNELIAAGVDSLLFLTPNIIDTANGLKSIDAIIASVPPGTNSVEMTFKTDQPSGDAEGEEVCITGSVSPPMVKNTPTPTASDCMATVMDCAFKIAFELSGGTALKDCIKNVLLTLSGISSEVLGLEVGLTDGLSSAFTGGQVQAGAASKFGNKIGSASAAAEALVSCAIAAGGAIPLSKFPKMLSIANQIRKLAMGAATTTTIGGCISDSYNTCTNQDENGGTKRTFKKTRAASSLDPNLKSGPGIAGDNYVNGFNTMSYTIQFENVDTAALAAQVVTIIDSLDVSMFDLSTFAFLDYGFGNTLIPVITGNSDFTDILDLRPSMPNLLRIDGSIDTLTGVITWVFTTLDTTSLSLTEDPIAGFLPPNVNSPEGQGFVSFGIELNESVVSGDIIENNSVIIFDTNEPIVTNTWDNGFDDVNPSSQINPLPAIINDTSFVVTWSGNDDASGVRWYDIYVSINDEEYLLLLSHINEVSWIFDGEYGSNYKFYSIATDKAGNVEEAPGGFDAETTLEVFVDVLELKPETSWLAQNFPNPTDGLTTITYSIKGSQKINLVLIDMLGRPIMILDEGIRSGEIQMNKNLSNFADGVYYLILNTESERFTRKLIINR